MFGCFRKYSAIHAPLKFTEPCWKWKGSTLLLLESLSFLVLICSKWFIWLLKPHIILPNIFFFTKKLRSVKCMRRIPFMDCDVELLSPEIDVPKNKTELRSTIYSLYQHKIDSHIESDKMGLENTWYVKFILPTVLIRGGFCLPLRACLSMLVKLSHIYTFTAGAYI